MNVTSANHNPFEKNAYYSYIPIVSSFSKKSRARAAFEPILPPDTEYDPFCKVGAWFLGPKAENMGLYEKFAKQSLHEHSLWRRSYFPEDKAYITERVKNNPAFKDEVEKIEKEAKELGRRLRNSQPFFSSRYKGHMNWDTSMVGSIGHFLTSLWNPNNVASEGSPVTTALEIEVGQQLCKMLGYKTEPLEENDGIPESWGHITSCGSAANIESLWAARSLRYLPQALKKALNEEKDLKQWKNAEVVLAKGRKKILIQINDEWELLNIPADNILKVYFDIAKKKQADDEKKHIEGAPLESYVGKYDISHTGMGGVKQGCFIVPASRHYSWDKAGALLGIGQDNMMLVNVNTFGRMNMESLTDALNTCFTNKTPVLSVVAVVGTTAEGAIDPVDEILALREMFRKNGLDFFIHADAAWGGYLCSLLAPANEHVLNFMPLREVVYRRLEKLRDCDSITIDPHKSGYIQYPAGALCYRNGATRYLLNFTAPILFTGKGDPSVGMFGLDGSKPGAAVAATYLHNKVVGLGPMGHGLLLTEAIFTSKIIYCVLYTLAEEEKDPFRIATYQPLPNKVDVAILKEILGKSVGEVQKNEKYLEALREIGPDVLINGMVVNFKWPLMGVGDVKAEWNKDSDKANEVIRKMADELNNSCAMTSSNVLMPHGVVRKKLFMIRNTLTPPYQMEVAEDLRRRINLTPAPNKSLNFLVATNMDPWPTATGFMDVFRRELRQSIFRCIGAVMEHPHVHGFVATDAGDYSDEDGEFFEVFGDHLPVFSEPQHQYHIIVKYTFKTREEKHKYFKMAFDAGGASLIFGNAKNSTLEELLHSSGFINMDIHVGPLGPTSKKGNALMRITDIIRYEHFQPLTVRPKTLQYMLYGNDNFAYLSHCPSVYPDYHHVAKVDKYPHPELSKLPLEEERDEQSKMRLSYGTLVNIHLPGDVPPADLPKTSPLLDGTPYKFTYTAEYGYEATSFLTVAHTVWYDIEMINISKAHH